MAEDVGRGGSRRLLPQRFQAALRPEPAVPLELPDDLRRESRQRIRIAAALGAAGYLVFLAAELTSATGTPGFDHTIDLWHDSIGLSLGAVLLAASSIRRVADRPVFVLALAVEILVSALISIAVPWAGFVRTGHVSAPSWVVPIIILFPVLVPERPRVTLAVSVLCALTMPLGTGWLAVAGRVHAAPSDLWSLSLAGLVAVGISSVTSRTVHGARRQVASARALGSYELLERLGQGGMGEVWKARHSLLAREAAIKLIRPEMLQGPSEQRDAALRRFTQEARVTASLRSPHTVELYDFGVTADGSLYYAMELLQGMNVEHFVYRFGPVDARRAVHWLRQACHSLDEAHARGLVHRDIKPGNLYLCRYGREADFVKVLDFGLTRPIVAGEDQRLTIDGSRPGTPAYMAPEQVYGLPIGPRTDLYALGCVGYWLLAGLGPFEAESGAELMRMHAQAIPAALSARAPRAVPERLERLIMACLEKEPERRPSDAGRLSAQLAESLDGAPWTAGEAHDWWARNLDPDRPTA